jgi:hypothetical protein
VRWLGNNQPRRSVTRVLPDELYERYRHYFHDQQRARQLLVELDALGVAALEADPAYGRHRGRGPT